MASESPAAVFVRERWPLLIALWVAISSNAAIIYLFWPDALAADYSVFWRVVHSAQPYAPHISPFAYPPTTLVWLQPLRLIAEWPGYLAWTALSVVAFVVTAIRLYGRAPTALAFISPAVPLGLMPGQTSLLASALLFAAFASEKRLLRGLLLGALLTFKPQLAFVAPLFLIVRREWLELAVMAVAVLVMALVTTVMFGMAIWSDWLAAIPGFQQEVAGRGLAISAVSLATFATSLGLPRLPLLVLGCAAGLMIALMSRRLNDPERAAMIAAASLVAAPYALRYDLVAIAPAMAAVILTEGSRNALLACIAYSATFGPFSIAAAAAVVDWRSRGRNADN
jgi:hypothetical protein